VHRLMLFILVCFPLLAQDGVSRFAIYRGYSEPRFERWFRFSDYLTVRDGTRLAYDLYRPAESGRAVEEPLPVIFSYKRFHRSLFAGGTLTTDLDTKPWVLRMIEHGYVVVTVDARGAGASFGSRPVPFLETDGEDIYDIAEWIAEQPWSNGRIGLYGTSFQATSAMMALAEKPRLDAVMAEKPMFDLYDFIYGGGIYQQPFVASWARVSKQLDEEVPPPPTDRDAGGKQLKQAIREHRDNGEVDEIFAAMTERDSLDPAGNKALYLTDSPHVRASASRAAGIPVLLIGGWYDAFTTDTLLWYQQLDRPKRLIVGPWTNRGRSDRIMEAEVARWFDRFLRDIDNGVDEEPPVAFHTPGGKTRNRWRFHDQWPPVTDDVTYYLAPGGLGSEPVEEGTAVYRVDLTVGSGELNRWSNAYGKGGQSFSYRDRAEREEGSLSHTGEPLEETFEIAGYPMIHLAVSSSSTDGDVYVYLEDVAPDGEVAYVTEGFLRASHRTTGEPPYAHPDIPWWSGRQADHAPLEPNRSQQLSFALLPTAYRFAEGHRIRLRITGADAHSRAPLVEQDPPTLTFTYGDGARLVLPVVP